MNLHRLRWSMVAAFIGIVMLAGCSSDKDKTEAPAASTQAAPQTAAPSGESEHGESAEVLVPAGTIAGIWMQIGEEQAKLSATIQNGQLKDVHHLAFGIRDLVVALVDKASAATPATAGKLKGMVEQVKASAAKLDELGDAGNLSGTQAEYAKLDTVLNAIKTATASK